MRRHMKQTAVLTVIIEKYIVGHFVMPNYRPVLVSRRTAFNYKEADFNGLRRALSLIHWGILDDLPINSAVELFYFLLEGAIADHIPSLTVRCGQRFG